MYAHEEDSKMGPAFKGRQWLDAEVYYQSSDISVISNDASLTNKDLRKMHRITINVFSLLGRPVRAHPLEVVFFEDEDKVSSRFLQVAFAAAARISCTHMLTHQFPVPDLSLVDHSSRTAF